ncbi:hypothetical protein C8J57DRAFT_1642627 [Mycena rebaudengoi]|nr:hypothetical protein C8J57DRAFT_1642627 [Mycena rebaudengoi]
MTEPLPEGAIYLGHPSLPEEFLKARTDTQARLQTMCFEFSSQFVCNVSTKDDWPDPTVLRLIEITGETYLTPHFDLAVTPTPNERLVSVVAIQANLGLQNEDLRPVTLTESKATWDLPLLQEMAKKSFSNFKPQWKRITKVEQIKLVVRAYAVKRRLDPDRVEGLLSEAFESDEASGPEDDSGESQETWKARMAATAGISVSSRSTYESSQFVEVLDLEWRTNETCTPREKWNSLHSGSGTGRSSRRIPDLSPWDFGISAAWLEASLQIPENAVALEGWGTYGNPPGFDASFLDALISDPPQD